MTEQIEQELKLASRRRRFVAYAIDHVVMTFIIVMLVFLIIGGSMLDDGGAAIIILGNLLAIGPGMFLYFAKDSIKGISVGKWVMGIMVRSADNANETPKFSRLLIRNIFMIIWPVELFMLISNSDKRRLGDKYGNSIVVRNPKRASRFLRIVTLISTGAISIFTLVVFISFTIKGSDAYDVAIYNIEQNQDVIEATGGIVEYGMFPSGSVNVSNGAGVADINIKVIGKDNDIEVGAYLTKEPGEDWVLQELY